MSKRRHNFGTKRFKEKSLFIFHARIALKSLILLFVRLIARGARIWKTHTQTDTQTDRQNEYCNPRACAPRVNKYCNPRACAPRVNEKRKILLFIDSAGCHPDNLLRMLSNIKICFLPPNTTSALQPLDLGIIKNFKLHYRRFFLRYVISKMDECDTASDIVKSVNLLVDIRRIALAWSEVTPDTIVKCFRKAGILDAELDVVCLNDEDPFWR